MSKTLTKFVALAAVGAAGAATLTPNFAYACPGVINTVLQFADPNCNLDRLNHDAGQPVDKLIDGLVAGLLSGG